MDYKNRLANVLSNIISNPSIDTKFLTRILKPANKNVDADFAINCFALKNQLKKNGPEIAKDLSEKLTQEIMKKFSFIQSITVAGPYLNFKISKTLMAKEVLTQIFNNIDEYASSHFKIIAHPKRIVIEYPSPGTNKPLHLGHVRNMILGQALSTINQCVGNKVFQTNLFNDKGVHICKSMWGFEKFGNNLTPESENKKSDHFVGDYYVKFSEIEAPLKEKVQKEIDLLEYEKNKEDDIKNFKKITKLEEKIEQSEYGALQKEIKNMLFAWENEDTHVRALWRKMNDWAENGYNETFKLFKIHHDKIYFESEIFNQGKDIVEKGLKDGIFEKLEDGAVVINFNKKSLPKQKVLIRRDGTSLYITQDLYLAYEKMKDFNYDSSIYVIGNEQDMQLRILFEILKKLGMEADNFHYSYGMINLTSGKMKSREGTVVDADDIVLELKNLAFNEVRKRYNNLSENDLETRAFIIAMASLRFFILKYDYSRDFIFDPKKSISFEGETGPYILYSYARICSIFKKGLINNIKVPYNPNTDKIIGFEELDLELISLLQDEHEIKMIEILYNYPRILSNSVTQMKPHILTRYLYEIAQEFTGFYHSCPIIKENSKLRNVRLLLCESIRRVLKHGLGLLTIDVLTEM